MEPGFCRCGCGKRTGRWDRSIPERGIKKGDYREVVVGHGGRVRTNQIFTVDPETGCWVFQLKNRSHKKDGYGRLNREGRQVVAHKYFYEKKYGPVPRGMMLDHLCRNRACCNPDHVEPVTCAENSRRGANAKLAADDVAIIRLRIEAGESCTDIAKAFGVCRATISHIKNGRLWKR